MFKEKFRFRLIDLVLLMTLFPVAIGFGAACYSAATYVEAVVLDDPLAELRRAVVALEANSLGIVSQLFYQCLMTMIRVVFCWLLIVLAMSFFALGRSKIARSFSMMLILSVPVIEWLLSTRFSGFTDHLISLAIAECIVIFAFLVASTLVLTVICKKRPILDSLIAPTSARFVPWRKISVGVVVIVTILISAAGLNGLSALE